MLIGYGLVNSISQLIIRPIGDKLSSNSKKEEIISQIEKKMELDKEILLLNKSIELSNGIKLQEYSHTCRLEEAKAQFKQQLELWHLGQFNNNMWPLLTPFDHPSLKPNYNSGDIIPINIFLAKTDAKSPYAILSQSSVKNKITNYFQMYTDSKEHPVVCRIGDWKEGFYDVAFINALWYGMKGLPSIIINPIHSEFSEDLNISVSFWGLGENGLSPITQNIFNLNFGQCFGKAIKSVSREWIEAGLPILSAEMRNNQNLLNQENSMIAVGKGEFCSYLLGQYQPAKEIRSKAIEKLNKELSLNMACIAGMFSDLYFLLEYGITPKMPSSIKKMNHYEETDFIIPEQVALCYHKALLNLASCNYLGDRIPSVFAQVASSVASFNHEVAKTILEDAINIWFSRKNHIVKSTDKNIKSLISEVIINSDSIDADFLSHIGSTCQLLHYDSLYVNIFNTISNLKESAKSLPKKKDCGISLEDLNKKMIDIFEHPLEINIGRKVNLTSEYNNYSFARQIYDALVQKKSIDSSIHYHYCPYGPFFSKKYKITKEIVVEMSIVFVVDDLSSSLNLPKMEIYGNGTVSYAAMMRDFKGMSSNILITVKNKQLRNVVLDLLIKTDFCKRHNLSKSETEDSITYSSLDYGDPVFVSFDKKENSNTIMISLSPLI